MKKYSGLRDMARHSLGRLLPLEFPISMYVEPTNRCNFRCRYCPMSLPGYAKASGGFKMMSLSQFTKICHDIKDGGHLKALRFYLMGEPLLNPHLAKMIAMAHRMKLSERTELTTNAVFLNRGISRALINSGLDYLRISISSVDPKRHERITQTRVEPGHIRDNIKNFRRIRSRMGCRKPFIYIKMLDALDDVENSNFLKIYKPLGDEAAIEVPMNWNEYNNHDLLQGTYGKGRRINQKELYPYPKEVCPFPFYTLAVNVNGDVTVCCVDWLKATRVGNVFESTLKSIWDGEELRNFRRMHLLRVRRMNVSCRNCKYLYTTPDNIDDMPRSRITDIIGADI